MPKLPRFENILASVQVLFEMRFLSKIGHLRYLECANNAHEDARLISHDQPSVQRLVSHIQP